MAIYIGKKIESGRSTWHCVPYRIIKYTAIIDNKKTKNGEENIVVYLV